MGYFDLQREKHEVFPVEEKPGVIGMIVPSLHDPFIYGITPYLQKAFASIGVGFSIMTKDPDDDRYNRLISAFRKFYSGLILVGEAADDYTVRSLRSSGYPFVMLEKSVKILRLNTVCTDIKEGSRRVAEHIEKLGYKNALLVSDRNHSSRDGHLIHLLQDSLGKIPEMNKPVFIEYDRHINGNDTDWGLIDKYLRPPYRAEVMIILHAELVYRTMDLLSKKKIRVPQDIAIISMSHLAGS